MRWDHDRRVERSRSDAGTILHPNGISPPSILRFPPRHAHEGLTSGTRVDDSFVSVNELPRVGSPGNVSEASSRLCEHRAEIPQPGCLARCPHSRAHPILVVWRKSKQSSDFSHRKTQNRYAVSFMLCRVEFGVV